MIGIMALIVLGTLALVLAYWIFVWLVSWVASLVCNAMLLVGLDC